ncbi:MAG: hypothetical protein COB01_02940 [Lutibacter sp.]|nr:MAG: hypothetical protein COB01_02940 [Lutibacter sp.]
MDGIINDFFCFFRKPIINVSIYKKPIERFHLFSLGFLLIVLGILITAILQFIIVKYIDNDFTNFKKLNYSINYLNLLKIVIIAPIIEELGFRLFLKPKKVAFLSLSLSIISFYFIGFIFRDFQIYYKLSIAVFIFILSFFYAKRCIKFIENNYVFIFYLTAFIFAFFHLKTHYSLTQTQYVLFPIIILPYFIYGLSFSYVRIKSNTFLAVLLHITINGIAFFIKYLSTNI